MTNDDGDDKVFRFEDALAAKQKAETEGDLDRDMDRLMHAMFYAMRQRGASYELIKKAFARGIGLVEGTEQFAANMPDEIKKKTEANKRKSGSDPRNAALLGAFEKVLLTWDRWRIPVKPTDVVLEAATIIPIKPDKTKS